MKKYEVLNELVLKTQELHRAIFDKGYGDGHEDGLNDAWECARKICKMNYETRREALGVDDDHDLLGKIFNTFAASEAIDKIKRHEEKQKQADNEIKVGDEVVDGEVFNS